MTSRAFHRFPPRRRDILILSFILIKALVIVLLWAGLNIPEGISSPDHVHAQEEVPNDAEAQTDAQDDGPDMIEPPRVDYSEDLLLSIQKERQALKAREEALREREENVRGEEARIQKVQREIEQRLETLSQIQASLQELIQEKKSLDNEILKKLARVYESTPPEQAGPMLARLDVKLAAEILIRMDGRKAGKIWGFVGPKRASEISSEIRRLQ